MSKSKTTAKPETTETTTAKGKAPRRVHVVPPPKSHDEATAEQEAVDAPERVVELDEGPGSVEDDGGDIAAGEAAEANAAAPTDKKKARRAARLARSKKLRALESAVKRLGELDPEDPELNGLAGAITFLKPILERVRAARKKGAPVSSAFDAGDEIRLRTKSAPKFAGIIEAADKLVVVATNAKFVTAKLASGEKVVLSRNDVEAVS